MKRLKLTFSLFVFASLLLANTANAHWYHHCYCQESSFDLQDVIEVQVTGIQASLDNIANARVYYPPILDGLLKNLKEMDNRRDVFAAIVTLKLIKFFARIGIDENALPYWGTDPAWSAKTDKEIIIAYSDSAIDELVAAAESN